MKICSKCKIQKEDEEFGTHIRKVNKVCINSRCKVCATLIANEYQKNNPNKNRNNRKWAKNNKEHLRIKDQKYKLDNRKKCNAIEAKRRAAKLKQTPKWSDLKAIEQFYLNCPKGYHVDHIIPLQGRDVRGLHVLNNLQYLPAKENISKGNKLEV